MSNRLEDLKQEYAEMHEFKNWNELRSFLVSSNQHKSLDEIEKDLIATYTEECCKVSLELSKENTSWFMNSNDCGRITVEDYNNILEMIDNPNNVVLL